MRRAAWIALVVVPLVTMPTWVHAAPPCGDPILQRHCVYLPAAIGPAGRGCERLTGDAFDDSTAWRLVRPAKGTARFSSEAALTGGVGLRLEPGGSITDAVGAQSVVTFRPEYRSELWISLWYRKIEGTSGEFSDWRDEFRGCVIPHDSSDSGGWAGCWGVKPPVATSTWTYVVENMDEEARQWRPMDLRASVEADGDTAWEVDDFALWRCKPGERPR